MSSNTPSRTADLYARSLGQRGLQSTHDMIIGRLDALTSVAELDEFGVFVWGDGLIPESNASRTAPGQRINGFVEEFRRWATTAGVVIEPFFPSERANSKNRDEEWTHLRVPTMTLAEYEDGALQFVSHCLDGDIVITVLDRLDTLEARAFSQPHTTRRIAEVDQIQTAHSNDG